MRPLSHHCTSCCCHAIHNIFFCYAQIMELCIYYEIMYKTTHCMYCLSHRLKMMWQCMRPHITLDQCTCPNTSIIALTTWKDTGFQAMHASELVDLALGGAVPLAILTYIPLLTQKPADRIAMLINTRAWEICFFTPSYRTQIGAHSVRGRACQTV